MQLNVCDCATRLRHRWSQLFLCDAAAVAAPEPRFSQCLSASANLDQPIEVRFAPAVTLDAVEPECVTLTAQVLEGYKLRHRPSHYVRRHLQESHNRTDHTAEDQHGHRQGTNNEAHRSSFRIVEVGIAIEEATDYEYHANDGARQFMHVVPEHPQSG